MPIFYDNQNFLAVLAFMIFFTGFFTYQTSRIQIEKLKAVEMHAAYLTHEMRRPVAGINILIASAKRVANKGNDNLHVISLLSEAQEESKRAMDLFTFFMDSQLRKIATEPMGERCSMRECIISAIRNYPSRDSSDAEQVKFVTPLHDFEFIGSENIMISALMNLLNNSLSAIHEKLDADSIVEVKLVKAVNLSEGSFFFKSNNYNMVEFYDNGIGIRPEDQGLIFEKFYTATEAGTGLGLPFVKEAIERIGGVVSCDSVVNKYTKMQILVPVQT